MTKTITITNVQNFFQAFKLRTVHNKTVFSQSSFLSSEGFDVFRIDLLLDKLK